MSAGPSRVDSLHVAVPGGRVFVRTWTPPVAEHHSPLVLLHDSLGSVELWREFPEALAACVRRPVVAYDRLGFGRSTPRKSLPSPDFVWEEAEVFFPALARGLDMARFSLLGHSVGGAMGLAVAAWNPSACDAVIAVAAQAFVEERTLGGIRSAREHFRSAAALHAQWQ